MAKKHITGAEMATLLKELVEFHLGDLESRPIQSVETKGQLLCIHTDNGQVYRMSVERVQA